MSDVPNFTYVPADDGASPPTMNLAFVLSVYVTRTVAFGLSIPHSEDFAPSRLITLLKSSAAASFAIASE